MKQGKGLSFFHVAACLQRSSEGPDEGTLQKEENTGGLSIFLSSLSKPLVSVQEYGLMLDAEISIYDLHAQATEP